MIRKKGDGVVVAQPYKGFPADRAGLQIGDRFVEIAGKDARGMTTEQVSALLKGTPNTNVTIKVEKLLTGQVEEVKLRRLNEMIHLQTELSAEANRRDEGREFDVLVEGFSKRSREQLCGRTEQNKMVVFDKGRHHIGETVRVRVTGSTSATLLGTATD